MRKRLDPLLERAIRAGLMTRDEAERIDDWAGELATRVCAGEVSQAEASAQTVAKAEADAHERRRRRQS